VSDVTATLGWGEQDQCDLQRLDDLIEAAWSQGPQKRFQLRERLFDGIEVGAVGWQEPEKRAPVFDGGAHSRLFVYGESVEDDDIAGSQPRHEDLRDTGEKGLVIDRPVEHGRRIDPIRA